MDLYNKYSKNDEYIISKVKNIYLKFEDGDIIHLRNVTSYDLTFRKNEYTNDYIDISDCCYSTLIRNKYFRNVSIDEICIKEKNIDIDDIQTEHDNNINIVCKNCFIENFKIIYNSNGSDNDGIWMHIEGDFINE